jgi:hypothetical protein
VTCGCCRKLCRARAACGVCCCSYNQSRAYSRSTWSVDSEENVSSFLQIWRARVSTQNAQEHDQKMITQWTMRIYTKQ